MLIHMNAVDSLGVIVKFRPRDRVVDSSGTCFMLTQDEIAYNTFISKYLDGKIKNVPIVFKLNDKIVVATFDRKNHYYYRFSTDDCSIFLSRFLTPDQPFCKIQLNQPAVWCPDPFVLVEEWVIFFKKIVQAQEATVDSIDLSTHYSGWDVVRDDDLHFSGILKKRELILTKVSRLFTGFKFGTQSDNSRAPFCRLYCKSSDLRENPSKPRPHAFYSIDANEQTRIWNLEFSYCSRSLRTFSMYTLSDVKNGLSELWKFGTTKAVVHKELPYTDRRFNRAKISKEWGVLASQFGVTKDTSIGRTMLKIEDPDGIYRLNKLKKNLLAFGIKRKMDLIDLKAILNVVARELEGPSRKGLANWSDAVTNINRNLVHEDQIRNTDI